MMIVAKAKTRRLSSLLLPIFSRSLLSLRMSLRALHEKKKNTAKTSPQRHCTAHCTFTALRTAPHCTLHCTHRTPRTRTHARTARTHAFTAPRTPLHTHSLCHLCTAAHLSRTLPYSSCLPLCMQGNFPPLPASLTRHHLSLSMLFLYIAWHAASLLFLQWHHASMAACCCMAGGMLHAWVVTWQKSSACMSWALALTGRQMGGEWALLVSSRQNLTPAVREKSGMCGMAWRLSMAAWQPIPLPSSSALPLSLCFLSH